MAQHDFIHDDFLLKTPAARALYHGFAESLPIIDYHCHLLPQAIADNQRWENLTQIWLDGDHYKWRAMRSNGVAEKYCTGDAGDWEKFEKWADTMSYLLKNPLYHWTHLELKRYLGIPHLLSPATAHDIWDKALQVLAQPDFSARDLIRRSNVVMIGTTDDPTDSLEAHLAIAADESCDVQVLPSWRPDNGMAIEDPAAFNAWIDRLAAAADTDIHSLDSYRAALRKRHAAFHAAGCRLSDHGIETAYAEPYTEAEIEAIFASARSGRMPNAVQVLKFKSAMLYEFGLMDHERDWTQQFHFGALRNNNTRMFKALGPNTGFDSIGDFEIARPLSRLLDRLDQTNQLARTILYNLNPRNNALLVAMLGNFQDGSIPGKIQHGSGWWFLDQKHGMEQQIETLAQSGLLRRFVGMLTDSRSFMSYTRHEYFRRILCNVLGNDMTAGIVPDDMPLVGGMVRDICYYNAARYFGFDVPV